MAAGAGPYATYACIDTWLTDFRDDLPKIDIPVLALHGTADRVLPLEVTTARLRDARLIADLTVVEVADGPHNIGWTHPRKSTLHRLISSPAKVPRQLPRPLTRFRSKAGRPGSPTMWFSPREAERRAPARRSSVLRDQEVMRDGSVPRPRTRNRGGAPHRLGRCRTVTPLLHRGPSRRDGQPGRARYVVLANSWIIINVGGGPTDDKPTIILETPADPDRVKELLNIRGRGHRGGVQGVEREGRRVSNATDPAGNRDPLLHPRSGWPTSSRWTNHGHTAYAVTWTCPVDTSTTPVAHASSGFTHESSGWLVIRETCSRS